MYPLSLVINVDVGVEDVNKDVAIDDCVQSIVFLTIPEGWLELYTLIGKGWALNIIYRQKYRIIKKGIF